MNTIQVEITIEEQTKRTEWIFRIIYAFFGLIVSSILGGITFYIMVPLNFITTLILGKRIMAINNFIKAAIKYFTKLYCYVFGLTDERPSLMPEF